MRTLDVAIVIVFGCVSSGLVDPETDTDPVCCDTAPNARHRECWPIEIPNNDPFYSLFRRRCMDFVRSASSLKANCKLGPRSQLNLITSTLDANFIYGSDKETADNLRTFEAGRLKSSPIFKDFGLKDLLPLKTENPDDGCIRATPDTYCFQAGDPRVNEQLVLTVTHVLIMREHNRIVAELAKINPHWDDERLYQASLSNSLRGPYGFEENHIERHLWVPLRVGFNLLDSNRPTWH